MAKTEINGEGVWGGWVDPSSEILENYNLTLKRMDFTQTHCWYLSKYVDYGPQIYSTSLIRR